ncbi:hypothetical protein [Veillonella parvula]|uniref:hypothetical protein n=1 Tax=Veillonella parvula TaxID=29466 RepID=UPI00241D85B0|nr:hypothetical protein [Veillonella parvula]MBS6139628.1 hypothetical protein [Veillonella parvula]
MHPSVSLSMTRVVTALTVYGIETMVLRNGLLDRLLLVATVLIVHGIETLLVQSGLGYYQVLQ